MTDSAHEIAGSEGAMIVAKAVCSERCAYPFAEPACWIVNSGALTRNCAGPDEPDCWTIGTIAARVLNEGKPHD